MRQINTRIEGLPPAALSLAQEIESATMKPLWRHERGAISLKAMLGRDSVWLFVSCKNGPAVTLRTAYSFGSEIDVEPIDEGLDVCFQVKTAAGTFTVEIDMPSPSADMVRCSQTFRPVEDLLIPHWPRDLFPLGPSGTPIDVEGRVRAAQRGLNAPLVFFTVDHEKPGTGLYFQNLTALNGYFGQTKTLPDTKVGGIWPELGYEIPPCPTNGLQGGKDVLISDAFICLKEGMDKNSRSQASSFLKMLSDVYRELPHPPTEFRDWPAMARKTLRDLESAPEATVREYGHLYVRPYLDAEYPDSMVQLAVLSPITEFEEWSGKEETLSKKLGEGVKKFYDPKLKTVRRYLPNVGKDKNKYEVDSWYLYHPLSNLAWLAKRGDEKARRIFFEGVDFSIRAARHFKYQWPVQYDIRNFKVIKEHRAPHEPGQSDVGGMYAYVMCQAWELSRDKGYIEEACKAIEALESMEFDLDYQANMVAFGAAACVRLHAITGRQFFLDQCKVFVASFLHNCILWESKQGHAKSYSVFLGASCLHDASYMAVYECSDSFAAFNQMLCSSEDIDEPMRTLLAEYCKYALSRAWFYYPANLPASALATEIRNGHIDRKLAFPVEDLYSSGEPAGSVGQEVYGCGGALLFTTRAFHRHKDVPFMIFAPYPVRSFEVEERRLTVSLAGPGDLSCTLRILPSDRHRRLGLKANFSAGPEVSDLKRLRDGDWEVEVPGNASVVLRWG